jgi:hypothetical protein
MCYVEDNEYRRGMNAEKDYSVPVKRMHYRFRVEKNWQTSSSQLMWDWAAAGQDYNVPVKKKITDSESKKTGRLVPVSLIGTSLLRDRITVYQ